MIWSQDSKWWRVDSVIWGFCWIYKLSNLSRTMIFVFFRPHVLSIMLFSRPAVSDSLRPRELQHTWPLYPSLSLSIPRHLLKFSQVHVHCISESIQPYHPLMPSSLPPLNLSQHRGLFLWVSCSHQVTKILELQLQHQSFQWVIRVDFP